MPDLAALTDLFILRTVYDKSKLKSHLSTSRGKLVKVDIWHRIHHTAHLASIIVDHNDLHALLHKMYVTGQHNQLVLFQPELGFKC